MERGAPIDVPVINTERLRLEPIGFAHSAGMSTLR